MHRLFLREKYDHCGKVHNESEFVSFNAIYLSDHLKKSVAIFQNPEMMTPSVNVTVHIQKMGATTRKTLGTGR